MSSQLQEGIYYNRYPSIGRSCAIMFLRVSEHSTSEEVYKAIRNLWKIYNSLKKGIIDDISGVSASHLHPGNLSVLIGYSQNVFKIRGAKLHEPSSLKVYGRLVIQGARGR